MGWKATNLGNALAAAVVSLVLTSATPADAAFYSGSELLAQCEGGEDSATPGHYQLSAFCMGYIAGVADVLAGKNSVNGYNAKFPERVRLDQLRRIVIKYLREHPQLLHMGAEGLVANALSDAFAG